MNSNYHLVYAISKRTPPSPKAWRTIASLQDELNRRCSWTHERLTLAPVEREPQRAPFLAFPLIRFAPARASFAALRDEPREVAVLSPAGDAWAAGATKVRDSLWNAHLVAAFLRHVSAEHPDLRLSLRDDGGFVVPGAIAIENGKVELERAWLNRERERALETFGDPQAAAPYVWAEAEALSGHFFAEGSAADVSEIREIQELGADWEQLRTMTIEDAAELVVDRVASLASQVQT